MASRHIKTWFTVYFSFYVYCTRYIVQCNVLRRTIICYHYPPFSSHFKSFLSHVCNSKIRRILVKQFHLLVLQTTNVKFPRENPSTWRNICVFRRRSVDFDRVSGTFTHGQGEGCLCNYSVHLWRHWVGWNYDVIVDVDTGGAKYQIGVPLPFTYHFAIFMIILYSML